MSPSEPSAKRERPDAVTVLFIIFCFGAVTFFGLFGFQIVEVLAGRDRSAGLLEVGVAIAALVVRSVGMIRLFLMKADCWLWLAAALVISRRRNRAPIAVAASNSSSAAILGVTLLVQPLLMLTAGFIIASTITFVVTANTWRGVLPARATVARDAAIGVTFAAIIYLVFTSGLGVVLP